MPRDSIREFERAASERASVPLTLRLFVAGNTSSSVRAVANIKRICERHARPGYVLEVIDVFQQPQHARDDQLVVIPTLVKVSPPPERRLVGDLGEEEKVLRALGLDSTPTTHRRDAKADQAPAKRTGR
ncbi:MAG TPA: circadian clock KaiB family protein [Polyangiaceae bacterium]|jgi:circadian clock protein KaiB